MIRALTLLATLAVFPGMSSAQEFDPSLGKDWQIIESLGLKHRTLRGMELRAETYSLKMKDGKLQRCGQEEEQMRRLHSFSSDDVFYEIRDETWIAVKSHLFVLSFPDSDEGWAKAKNQGKALTMQEYCSAFLERSVRDLFLAPTGKTRWSKIGGNSAVEFTFSGSVTDRRYKSVDTAYLAKAWAIDLAGVDLVFAMVGPDVDGLNYKRNLKVFEKLCKSVKSLTNAELEKYLKAELAKARGKMKERQWQTPLQTVGLNNWPSKRGLPGKTSESLSKAAEWLLQAQQQEGFWSSDLGLSSKSPPNQNEIGVTALVGRALLGIQKLEPNPEIESALLKAATWLLSHQTEKQLIGKRIGNSTPYNHAIACLFLLDWYQVTGSESGALQASIQAALDFILGSQDHAGGWDYDLVKSNTGYDTSVTNWCLLALASGAECGFNVDAEAVPKAAEALAAMADKVGRFGYRDPGTPPARLANAQEKFPPGLSEALTGIGLYGTLLADSQNPVLQEPGAMQWRAMHLLMARLPSEEEKAFDLYYWQIASCAVSMMGGKEADGWKKALNKVLLSKQLKSKEQNLDGAWPANSVWAGEGGQAYVTAMAVLSLLNAYSTPQLK